VVQVLIYAGRRTALLRTAGLLRPPPHFSTTPPDGRQTATLPGGIGAANDYVEGLSTPASHTPPATPGLYLLSVSPHQFLDVPPSLVTVGLTSRAFDAYGCFGLPAAMPGVSYSTRPVERSSSFLRVSSYYTYTAARSTRRFSVTASLPTRGRCGGCAAIWADFTLRRCWGMRSSYHHHYPAGPGRAGWTAYTPSWDTCRARMSDGRPLSGLQLLAIPPVPPPLLFRSPGPCCLGCNDTRFRQLRFIRLFCIGELLVTHMAKHSRYSRTCMGLSRLGWCQVGPAVITNPRCDCLTCRLHLPSWTTPRSADY